MQKLITIFTLCAAINGLHAGDSSNFKRPVINRFYFNFPTIPVKQRNLERQSSDQQISDEEQSPTSPNALPKNRHISEDTFAYCDYPIIPVTEQNIEQQSREEILKAREQANLQHHENQRKLSMDADLKFAEEKLQKDIRSRRIRQGLKAFGIFSLLTVIALKIEGFFSWY